MIDDDNIPVPHRINWLKYIFCSHKYASDHFEGFKICMNCGFPWCPWHPKKFLRVISKLDKRGQIIGYYHISREEKP